MKQKFVAGAAVLASCILGAAVGLASATADADSPLSDAADVQQETNAELGRSDAIPTEKVDELLAVSAVPDDGIDAAVSPVTLIENFDDSGDQAEIARLKKVAPKILEDLVAVGRVDEATKDVAKARTPGGRKQTAAQNDRINLTPNKRKDRRARLADLLTAKEAREQLESIEDGLAEVTADVEASHLAYVANTFRLDRFDGVEVTGDTARVVLRGAQEYRMLAGNLEVDRQLQYDLRLARDKGSKYGWVVVDNNAAFVEEASQ